MFPAWAPGQEVFARIESRKALRGDKQYEAADEVRVELEARGVVVMDSPQGTTWRPTPVLN
jgi:cysteinyl-tRNA synthetase